MQKNACECVSHLTLLLVVLCSLVVYVYCVCDGVVIVDVGGDVVAWVVVWFSCGFMGVCHVFVGDGGESGVQDAVLDEFSVAWSDGPCDGNGIVEVVLCVSSVKKEMPTPTDPVLYARAKSIVYKRYKVHSAYRSGAVVKLYKQMGGTYRADGREPTLKRWFKEKWSDVNPHKTRTSYPVYRPTVRVNRRTPLTVDEVDPRDLAKQARRKQVLRDRGNLEPFKARRGSRSGGKKYLGAKK